MKKTIIAVFIVSLFLFASCDAGLTEIMEKMGQNIRPADAPAVEAAFVNKTPEVKNEGILNQVGGLLNNSSNPVPMVGGLSDADKENLIDLANKNPEALEELKNTAATEEQKVAAEAINATCAVINGVLDALDINEELISDSEFPDQVKAVLGGVVEAVGKAGENAQSGNLTQADVIGMQIISGLLTDLVDTAVSAIPSEGVAVEGLPENVTADNLIQVIAETGKPEILGAVLENGIEDVVAESVDLLSNSIDFLNLMGMTGGVDSNALISGLLGSL